ncbi:MAG: amidohydrolase, partial [Anaerolineales bacterium]
MKPTQLLINGHIYDVHDSTSAHDAMALDGPTILAVGSNDDILKYRHADTSIIDLQQASVIPGITDSHIHLQLYALTLDQVDCETNTRQECLARVQEKVSNTPRGTWIRGHGWNQNQWSRFGTREELDAVAPDHPVYLTAKSLHAGWANSMALQFAGVTRETGDPPRGKLGRTPDGELDGIFFEDAMRLISEKIPPASVDQVTSALLHTQDKLLEMGITSVHDFDGPICFAALNRLRQAGQLKLRVVKHFRRESLQPMIDLGLATGVGDYHLRIGNLKLFADGALGPQTAAMLEPYRGTEGDVGMLTEAEEEILEIGRKASEYGIALAVHAIGDRANRTVLNALEKLIHEREITGCPALLYR